MAALEDALPKNVGEEVKLMFELFDKDGNGRITVDELKAMMKNLDGDTWTDEKVTRVLADFDKNGDGDFGFVEFWTWICGHGGKATEEFRPTLLKHAVDENTARLAIAEQKRTELEAKQEKASKIAADKARKEAEKAAGERITRKDYVEQQIAVGVSKEVATELFNKGDDDRDGEIDKDELGTLAADSLYSAGTIKSVFQKGVGGQAGAFNINDCDESGMQTLVQTFTSWDVDGDGTISTEELARVIKTLNPSLTEKTVTAMMGEVDTNGDGEIDINEFVAWMSGENMKKKKLKKKAKEEQQAKLCFAMHKKRSEEAKELKLQHEFEVLRHKGLAQFCEAKKMVGGAACNTVNHGPGSKALCETCKNRHGWLCHGCGFVSYFDDCVNGCSTTSFGWSCINGKCVKKCGCKKKPDFWQRTGFVGDLQSVSVSVKKMLEEPPAGSSDD